MSYRYKKRTHISGRKFRLLLEYFSLDLDALTISKSARLNRNTVLRYAKRTLQAIVRGRVDPESIIHSGH